MEIEKKIQSNQSLSVEQSRMVDEIGRKIEQMNEDLPDWPQGKGNIEWSKVKEVKSDFKWLSKEIIDNGGVSMNVKGKENLWGKLYITVSPYPNRSSIIPVNKFDDFTIAEYIEKNWDKLFEEWHMLWGWVDDGQVYLDVSLAIPKEYQKEAIKLWKKYNQKAVFDLETFEEINPLGDGWKIDIDEAIVLQDIKNLISKK